MPDSMARDERIARMYLDKVASLGKATAERQGPAYGAESTPWDRIAEAWNIPKKGWDEAQAWEGVMADAVQALADDPSLDRDDVLAEIPVRVADDGYPHRRKIVLSFGGTTDAENAEIAEEIEARAAKLRAERPPEPLPSPAPVPAAVPAPEMPAAPMSPVIGGA